MVRTSFGKITVACREDSGLVHRVDRGANWGPVQGQSSHPASARESHLIAGPPSSQEAATRSVQLKGIAGLFKPSVQERW